MFSDLLQKMFLRTSRWETQAWSSQPGSSSLGGGGPRGNASTVDCKAAVSQTGADATGQRDRHMQCLEGPLDSMEAPEEMLILLTASNQ